MGISSKYKPIVAITSINMYNPYIMTGRERDLPYTTCVETIATEILNEPGAFPLEESHIPQSAAALAEKKRQMEGGIWFPSDLANKLVAGVPDTVYSYGVVAYALLRTDAFRNWESRSQRLMLDFALTRDIGIHERDIASGIHQIGINTTFSEQRVAHLTSLRTRLREKGTPSPAAMKR